MKFITTQNDQLIWQKKITIDKLGSLSKEIAKSLRVHTPFFCLWVEGDIGSGKTTLTKELFLQLGLEKNLPVTSPTYTYLLEYKINHKWYAHMDFYRFTSGSSFEQEELLGDTDYSGFILEWPQNVKLPDSMSPTHKIHIGFENHKERIYQFYMSRKK